MFTLRDTLSMMSLLYPFLLNYRFVNNRSDLSLFIHCTFISVVIILIYVDDLVVISSNASVVTNYVSTYVSPFLIRTRGPLVFSSI